MVASLTDESFVVRDRLLHHNLYFNNSNMLLPSSDYFSLEGTRMHVADVEELYERLSEGKHQHQHINHRIELPDADQVMI